MPEKNVEASKPVKKPRRRKLPPNVAEKDGKWYVRKTITLKTPVLSKKGKPVYQSQLWRICEPQTSERAAAVLAEIEEDLKSQTTGIAAPLTNFGEIIDAYTELELVQPIYENDRKIAGRRSLAPTHAMLKTLKDYFGAAVIGDITFGDIEAFKLKRLKTPIEFKTKTRSRSIRSVNYELATLRQIFNFAARRRWIKRSPFVDGKNIIDTAQETRRTTVWTREEETAALALCTKRYAHMKPVIVLICDGGFRRGELLTAKWTDVDFENETIIAKSYKGKSFSARVVYMTDRMKKTLLEWKKEQKKIERIEDKSLIIGYGDIKKAWQHIRKEISREDLRVHDLRRVFASRLHYEAKAPISLVSKSLGHSNFKTTEIYINAQSDELREAIKRLDK